MLNYPIKKDNHVFRKDGEAHVNLKVVIHLKDYFEFPDLGRHIEKVLLKRSIWLGGCIATVVWPRSLSSTIKPFHMRHMTKVTLPPSAVYCSNSLARVVLCKY